MELDNFLTEAETDWEREREIYIGRDDMDGNNLKFHYKQAGFANWLQNDSHNDFGY